MTTSHRMPPFVEVALDLSKALDAADRHRRLLATIRRALPIDGGMLLRREGAVLRAVAIDGLQRRALDMEFPLDNPAVAGLVEERQPFRKVGRVGLLLDYAGVPDAEQPDGVLIGLPLYVADELVGALNLGNRDPRAFDAVGDDEFLVYAALAAAALRTANLLQALEHESALRRQIAAELEREARQRIEGPLLGESAAAYELRAAVDDAAASDVPLLVLGPPGSGKEAIARSVHASSARRHGGFLHVSCALVRTGDERIFGTASRRLLRRAALSDGEGKLELAHGGTLYLDGIDQLDRGTQLEIARYLEAHARRAAHPDVRIVAALSADGLGELRKLHPGLRRALVGHTIVVPPLADRRSDVETIAAHYLRMHARRRGTAVWELTPEARALLARYDWPGNIREVRNVIERAVSISRGSTLALDESLLESRPSLGSYSLMHLLGEGGMGQVWLATHRLLSRPAAVKVIRGQELARMGDPALLLRRFEREARATAQLRSPHTVHVYDFGATDEGAFYYAMEHLSGMDLDTIVEYHGALPPERVVHFLLQACDSLEEAHAAGMVHRDIKPANLFACDAPAHDFLKVLDFGLVTTDEQAAESSGDTLGATLRDPGAVDTKLSIGAHGTPAFMAPEMLVGAPVDARSDIYALGCVAYFLLTGELPFDGRDAFTVAIAHLRASAPPLEKHGLRVPPALEELVRACMQKEPDARPASAAIVRGALERLPLERWSAACAQAWWRSIGR